MKQYNRRKLELSSEELEIFQGKSLVTLEEAFEQFIDSRILKGVRDTTLRKYRDTMKTIQRDCETIGITNDLLRFTRSDVKALHMYWIKGLGHTVSTINGMLSQIKAIFNFWYEEQLISENLGKSIIMMGEVEQIRDTLDDGEIIQLSRYFLKQKTFVSYRNYVIFKIMLATGIRVSECMHIKLADIHKEFIVVTEVKGVQQRLVYLSKGMYELIVKYIKIRGSLDTDYLFVTVKGTQLNKKSFQEDFKDVVVACEIDKRITSHSLRRSYAKMAVIKGMDAFSLASLLGHQDLRVTQRYVQIYGKDLQKQAMKTIDVSKLV